MQHTFYIEQFGIWPPKMEKTIEAQQKSLLAQVPAILRRRLSRLSKQVFCAALQCDHWQSESPVIFSSAHGELAKSLAMMKQIERNQDISPANFSLSVHNAIAGLFSIAFGIKQQISVLAPCQFGMVGAFIEALGLFLEGHQQVLVVFYDEPLPDFFPARPYPLNCHSSLAVAMLLNNNSGDTQVELSRCNVAEELLEQPLQLEHWVSFLTTSQSLLTFSAHGAGWQWRKYVE